MEQEPIYESLVNLTGGTYKAGDYYTAIPVAYTWSVHEVSAGVSERYIKNYNQLPDGGCTVTMEQRLASKHFADMGLCSRMVQMQLPPPAPVSYYRKARNRIAAQILSSGGTAATLRIADGDGGWFVRELTNMPAKLSCAFESVRWRVYVAMVHGWKASHEQGLAEFIDTAKDLMGVKKGPDGDDEYSVCTWLCRVNTLPLTQLLRISGCTEGVLSLPQTPPWTSFASMTLQLELVGYSTESRIGRELAGRLSQDALDAVRVSMTDCSRKLREIKMCDDERRERFVEDWLGDQLFAVVKNKVRAIPQDRVQANINRYIEKQGKEK